MTGGSGVTEGGDATFTLTATPAPASDLSVTVTVAADGDWGVTAGTRTVTVPSTGSLVLALPTVDDGEDEQDGSVGVTIDAGTGYAVGDPASGTVAVVGRRPAAARDHGDGRGRGDGRGERLVHPHGQSGSILGPFRDRDRDGGGRGRVRHRRGQPHGDHPGDRVSWTLPTVDDGEDERDGSVSVAISAGNDYAVGDPASGTVAVSDDDLPPPVVTIAAKAASVTEGGDAAFTLTADRAPDADLTVTLTVAETGEGDHVAAADEGPAAVTIPKGAAEAMFALATVDDSEDEKDGSVSVTIEAGEGYAAGDPATASVEVKDDDLPSTMPALSVGDSTAEEGGRLPIMPFTVRLSPASVETVRVHVSTRPSDPVSAEPGVDYAPGSYDLTFRAGGDGEGGVDPDPRRQPRRGVGRRSRWCCRTRAARPSGMASRWPPSPTTTRCRRRSCRVSGGRWRSRPWTGSRSGCRRRGPRASRLRRS